MASNTQLLILKFGLYPEIGLSRVKLRMVYTMDACGCWWKKRPNFSCSLNVMKISMYRYYPKKKKSSLKIDKANYLFFKDKLYLENYVIYKTFYHTPERFLMASINSNVFKVCITFEGCSFSYHT